jgi:predicted  nucleic acid-binding Zn-ribbon protein
VEFRSLLAVQAADLRIAQLEHRRAHLPEHALAAEAKKQLDASLAEAKRLEKRQGDITSEIERLEKRGKELDAKKAKYDAQLKTVIAVREAEALQHEIAGVVNEHRALDDTELTLLGEGESLDASLTASRAATPALDAAAAAAATVLAAALNAVDADLAAARDERVRLAGLADAQSLALYDQVRSRMTSAAVAELSKGVCGGCRTALSPKEQAELKKVADTTEARCPYCSCLLVV